MQTVLFVGLGAMGRPMARRVAATYDVTLADADPVVAERLAAELDVPVAPDLATAAATSDVVVLMLPNSDIVEMVLVGDGVLAALHPGACVVDMGSSRPVDTVALAGRASTVGVGYVDAPVSGGAVRAASGELSIMAGGTEDDVERLRPLLLTMGTSLVRTGDAGTGHAMKALNNMLSAIGLLGASEVLAVGAKFGLEPQAMLDVLNHSTGRNQATEVKFEPFVLSGSFASGFAFDLMVKDLGIANDLADQTGVPHELIGRAVETWRTALADLERDPDREASGRPPRVDHTEIADWVATRAGADLRQHQHP